MNAVEKDIELLVEKELKSANEKFPMFASAHEGYAVLLEEVEEAELELVSCKNCLDALWYEVKSNNKDLKKSATLRLKQLAQNLSCEAIQVAAMAQKFIDSSEDKEQQIKPCTTCGGSATVIRHCDALGTDIYRVECQNIDCQKMPCTEWRDTEAEVIKEWNKMQEV
jgi:hypothetical protein